MSYQYQHQGSRYHIPFESGNLSERNNNGYARRRVEQAGGGMRTKGQVRHIIAQMLPSFYA